MASSETSGILSKVKVFVCDFKINLRTNNLPENTRYERLTNMTGNDDIRTQAARLLLSEKRAKSVKQSTVY